MKVGLDDGLEVEVNKSRNSPSDRMKGSNNGAARVIGFVDIGKRGVEKERRVVRKWLESLM